MKKYKYIVVMFLASLCLSCLFFKLSAAEKNPSNSDHPDIEFQETIYDFGAAGQQEEIVHDFFFKNVGGKTLTIKGVRTCCGCIAKSVSNKTILPGESGSIKVIFETRKYRGRRTKSIFVESDDPGEPEIELKISGIIRTEMAVIPEFLYFGDVAKGKETTKELKLIQIGEKELRLEKVDLSAEYLSAQVCELVDDRNRGFKINVSLGTNTPVGKLAEVITLYTNLKRRPRIDVPIAGNILGRIRVKPQMLSLGCLKKGEKASQKIAVMSADGKDFQIIKVVASVPFVSTKVSKINKDKGFEIAIKAGKNAPAGKIKGIQGDAHENMHFISC
ncbi:MAG: DUF1573 domain-containing protein [Thermodesulfobacteriota bacterium]|nr:DUF1573 domain-containing protein [Thermodesulfobacteriota bacterium]